MDERIEKLEGEIEALKSLIHTQDKFLITIQDLLRNMTNDMVLISKEWPTLKNDINMALKKIDEIIEKG